MRVITGSARGARLTALPGLATRPTVDRVKEAVFSALQFELYGARVLDLFAGSGQLGIEALSRGASEAVFVDAAPQAAAVIRENLARTRLAGRARVMQTWWEGALRSLAGGGAFDIVLLDPPYREALYVPAIEALCARELTHPGTVIVAESDAAGRPPKEIGAFVCEREKKFGTVGLGFYRRRDRGEESR